MSRVETKQKWILAATAVLATVVFGIAIDRADAARAVSVSPQGKVAHVRQALVKFDEADDRLRQPRRAAPGKLACSGAPAAALAGTGALDRRQNLGLRFHRRPAAGRALLGRSQRRTEVRGGHRAHRHAPFHLRNRRPVRHARACRAAAKSRKTRRSCCA